jgi:hypothetical protein
VAYAVCLRPENVILRQRKWRTSHELAGEKAREKHLISEFVCHLQLDNNFLRPSDTGVRVV